MRKTVTVLAVMLALLSCKKEQKKGIEQVPATVFLQDIEADKGQLIDVRTPKEYKDGHIKGAANLHIYDNNFAARLDSLDKNETVYVYCKAGGRSAEAVEIMQQKGFKHIVELEGGLDAWNDAQQPVIK